MNLKLIFLIFVCMPFQVKADTSDLPVTLARDNTRIQITNMGDCPIYKLRVYTAPPADSGFKRLLNSIVAVSFEKDIGTLNESSSITLPKSDLINSDGKRLDSSYVIGRWYLRGSYCGENLSKVISN
ncbi:hypothetical protein GTH32_00615 [Alteromonas sp. 345S023]|jgi:hypothetical protein|uniref:CHRD domain-containing protein n=1 Tax=Alteromonas profundi TaxID=2696062 RepID=A0A7X5RJJ2_9ALTE|nr:hypothetical protein [Alteromonas profundi]NDV89699.1 hypothetical protein [Alteromonas profundi]